MHFCIALQAASQGRYFHMLHTVTTSISCGNEHNTGLRLIIVLAVRHFVDSTYVFA